MKTLRTLLSLALLAPLAATAPLHAQTGAPAASHDHHAAAPNAPATDAAALSDAEVVRWDAATSRVTLRHGELKNLDMPPMTMVFRVKESTAVPLAPGLRVRFLAERDAGGFVASRIEPAKP